MSWSLQIHNGDLVTSGAQFGVVTNEQKLVQDLRCAILEHMGTDNMHPEFGSLIDGGTRPDGVYVPGVIGEDHVDLVVMAIESEIQRISQDYQSKQLSRAKADRYTYNKATLSAREVLLGVTSITFTQTTDTLDVNVTLQTAANGVINLTVPLLIDTPLLPPDDSNSV